MYTKKLYRFVLYPGYIIYVGVLLQERRIRRIINFKVGRGSEPVGRGNVQKSRKERRNKIKKKKKKKEFPIISTIIGYHGD